MTAPFPTRPAPPAILTPGLVDGWLATPEQAAALEAEERRQIDARIAEYDASTQSMGVLRCPCCGGPSLRSGVPCDECQPLIDQARFEHQRQHDPRWQKAQAYVEQEAQR